MQTTEFTTKHNLKIRKNENKNSSITPIPGDYDELQ